MKIIEGKNQSFYLINSKADVLECSKTDMKKIAEYCEVLFAKKENKKLSNQEFEDDDEDFWRGIGLPAI